MQESRRLRWLHHSCASYSQTRYGVPDYNIDWRGWHPPHPEISPDADTITHVLAAEHRLLNSLESVPSMANLGHLLTSQRELSNLAAGRARDIAPEQAAQFRNREQNLGKVSKAARTADGLAGTGASATQHSSDAVRLLVTIPVGEAIGVDALRNLEKLFRHVDNTLCRAIEHGFNTRIYLVRNTLPRIDPTDGLQPHQARQIFEPLQHEGRAPLVALARRHLRSDPVRMAPQGLSRSRALTSTMPSTTAGTPAAAESPCSASRTIGIRSQPSRHVPAGIDTTDLCPNTKPLVPSLRRNPTRHRAPHRQHPGDTIIRPDGLPKEHRPSVDSRVVEVVALGAPRAVPRGHTYAVRKRHRNGIDFALSLTVHCPSFHPLKSLLSSTSRSAT